MPISSHPSFLLDQHHPSPRQPQIYFLSLYVCLLWMFRIYGVIQYVIFCDWFLLLSIMFPRFIHIMDISVLHYLLLSNNIPLYGYTTFSLSIHQLMGLGVFSALRLLSTMLLWTFMYKILYVCIFSFFLGVRYLVLRGFSFFLVHLVISIHF